MSRQTSVFLTAVITASLLFTACSFPGMSSAPTPTPAVQESIMPAAEPVTETPAPGEPSSMKQGTPLTVVGTYQSPAGPESVGFKLVVDSTSMIVDAQTEVLAKNPTSVQRQTAFAAEFSSTLVGKKLSELEKVDRIGGSSLTTASFNKALSEFKAQI